MYDVFYPFWPVVDVIVPLQSALPVVAGKTHEVETMGLEPGGLANTLLAGVRLGLTMLPFGLVGDDPLGSFLLDEYRKERIDTASILVEPGYETRKVLVLVDTEKQHAFISMNNGEFGSLDAAVNLLPDCRCLCLTGYYLASSTTREAALKILRQAKMLGKPVFFDPGPMISKIPPDVLEEGLSLCDYIIANDEEAVLLVGGGTAEECAARLSLQTGALIVIKAGPKGCYIVGREQEGRWYGGLCAELRDTTGAGDSFLAAFLYGVLKGMSLERTALLSNATGAAMVEKVGSGRCVPTREEITSILTRNGFDSTGIWS